MNLNQVTVPSLDVPNAIDFYSALGLKLIVHTHDAYARFECSTGDATFSIHQVETLPIGTGTIVYFEVDDIDATYQELRDTGIIFTLKPTLQPWLWKEAHLVDPDGNKILLYHAGVNRLSPPWRLNR
ncbi:MAG TPA: glyoxalase/bleomycin resistance/extradiol dioxygenase family protein [Flavobacteriales bacterium]|jgi:catechol 2,3-dioxygenase-like lactoylglutathione lyase family enzyme|nr:VOC family protein [Flavobacteriales bacterium]HAW19038.1 glyoxalase/bleomycin resistance/extradiol dioxygenase family protein [Flavobacteriales bacterium]